MEETRSKGCLWNADGVSDSERMVGDHSEKHEEKGEESESRKTGKDTGKGYVGTIPFDRCAVCLLGRKRG